MPYTESVMPERSRKARKDMNTLAKSIVDQVTGGGEPEIIRLDEPVKNLSAVELGRLGGLKGGKARADKLTPKRRKQIAAKAAKARWAKAKKKK